MTDAVEDSNTLKVELLSKGLISHLDYEPAISIDSRWAATMGVNFAHNALPVFNNRFSRPPLTDFISLKYDFQDGVDFERLANNGGRFVLWKGAQTCDEVFNPTGILHKPRDFTITGELREGESTREAELLFRKTSKAAKRESEQWTVKGGRVNPRKPGLRCPQQ